jgi:hypothetical protein
VGGKELFLEQCIFYTEMSHDASFLNLQHCLEGTLDDETLRMYELRFETLTENKKPETLFQEFSELIKNTDKAIFRKLQKEYAHDLQKLQDLLIKAKEKSLI